MLEKARQAARSWNFSSARAYLDQARQKGYAPKRVRAVETLIAQNEAAKAEQDRREEERREEERRQARLAEDRRREAASASASSGGGCGNSWKVELQQQGTGAFRDKTTYYVRCGCNARGVVVSRNLVSNGSGGRYSYYMSDAGANFKSLHEAVVATCR